MARNPIYVPTRPTQAFEYRALPEVATASGITPMNVILHTNAAPTESNGDAQYRYMARPEITTECHLQVDRNGKIWQYVPFNKRADCNYKANQWTYNGVNYGAISIETADEGSLKGLGPWTFEQVDSIADILVFLNREWGIPLELPSSPFTAGVGYHSMWGFNTAAEPLKNPWTNVRGKTCPGQDKISQVPYVIQLARQRAVGGPVTPWKAPEGVPQPVLAMGNTGAHVADLQRVLNFWVPDFALEVNGVFGPRLKDCVQWFQAFNLGLSSTDAKWGVWDEPTAKKYWEYLQIIAALGNQANPPAPVPPKPAFVCPLPEPWLRQGDRDYGEGGRVTRLQNELKFWGYYKEVTDGVYGPMTAYAVGGKQRDLGVHVDGVYGPETHDKWCYELAVIHALATK